MKTAILFVVAFFLFSNDSFADDFYDRYLIESADCQSRSREAQLISVFYHCVIGALETIKGDPYYADGIKDADILITLNAKRAKAWEQYEDFKISEKELNIILGKIDRNE
jgi:hypothetical protein